MTVALWMLRVRPLTLATTIAVGAPRHSVSTPQLPQVTR
jgi:hypothetical protein